MKVTPTFDTPYQSGRHLAGGVPINFCKGTGVTTKTAAYTCLPEDTGKIFVDSTNAVTFTLPSTLPIGWCAIFVHAANTTMTVAGSGATVNGAASIAADNTQDPSAALFVVKTAAGNFSAWTIGTWA